MVRFERLYILSRSMEADMWLKLKELYILSRSMEADMCLRLKGSD